MLSGAASKSVSAAYVCHDLMTYASRYALAFLSCNLNSVCNKLNKSFDSIAYVLLRSSVAFIYYFTIITLLLESSMLVLYTKVFT